MGANKKYFTELRNYFQHKYSFVEEEMIWETLKTEEEKKDEEI